MIGKEYLAGFFDGEGCIYLGTTTASGTSKKYPHLIVTLSQSGDGGKTLLLNIQNHYGGRFSKSKKYKDSHKDAYQLRWTGKKAILFLDQIPPFLVIKKEKARQSCTFMEDYYANKSV